VYLLAPAPIFAVKRPRQALLAHPNNYAYDNIQPHPTGIMTFQFFRLYTYASFNLIQATDKNRNIPIDCIMSQDSF